MTNRINVLVAILILIIVILAGIVLYAFVIKPRISGYNVEKQTEGVEAALSVIVQRAASCQAVPLTYKNQTVTLVAIECLQQPRQEQPAPEQ